MPGMLGTGCVFFSVPGIHGTGCVFFGVPGIPPSVLVIDNMSISLLPPSVLSLITCPYHCYPHQFCH